MSLVALLGLTTGCAFNFELTSQRTALENQVMGTYAELEDDLVLVASVRADTPPQSAMSLKERASLATQNRRFNQDDIDELKTKGVLGEARDGRLIILPADVAGTADLAADVLKLARLLIDEENRDREVQWEYTIAANKSLTASDMGNVRETFAKLQRDSAAVGHWIQTQEGMWIQKTEAKKVEGKEDTVLESEDE